MPMYTLSNGNTVEAVKYRYTKDRYYIVKNGKKHRISEGYFKALMRDRMVPQPQPQP